MKDDMAVGRLMMGLGAAAVFAAAAWPAVALTDIYETPPEQDPAVVLGGAELGPGYKVETPVRSDGFLRIYTLSTANGSERIVGDGLLRLRIRELKALVALESLETNASFVEGLKEAARRPAEFVESVVSDPAGTAKNTVSGVGRLFGRLSRGVEQAVSGEATSPADLAKAITGQDRARRALAVELGVDPYTFYTPLSEKLDKTASVTTAGRWTISAIMALIPGGIIGQTMGTAENLRTMIVDNSRSELDDRVTAVLRVIGIPEETIASFFANPYFTPSERAVFAYRLQALDTVDGRDLLAASAGNAQTRDEAYFQLRRIVLTETYHRTKATLSQFRTVGGFAIALRRDGTAALILPLDLVSWTRSTGPAFVAINEGFARLPFPPSGIDFVMTGEITDMAAERLASFGWDITSELPMPDGPVP